jgi:hypothetical protein
VKRQLIATLTNLETRSTSITEKRQAFITGSEKSSNLNAKPNKHLKNLLVSNQ